MKNDTPWDRLLKGNLAVGNRSRPLGSLSQAGQLTGLGKAVFMGDSTVLVTKLGRLWETTGWAFNRECSYGEQILTIGQPVPSLLVGIN